MVKEHSHAEALSQAFQKYFKVLTQDFLNNKHYKYEENQMFLPLDTSC